MISRDTILDNASFAYWYQEILNPLLPEGSTLTLRTKIRTENIEGSVYMFIHSLYENDKYENGFYTTFPSSKINGTSDFKEVTLILENYKDQFQPTEKLLIGLGFENNTSGKVYFDDIHLEIQSK